MLCPIIRRVVMGKFKTMLTMLMVCAFVFAFAPVSFASVGVLDDGTMLGAAMDLNFTGATVTLSGGRASVALDAITSGSIDGAVIGGTTAAAGTFTTLEAETSMTLDGVTITSFGGVISPWTDGGATTTLNSAPAKFIATHATGSLFATQLEAGTGDVVLENAQIIDGGTNGAIKLTEAGDTLSLTYDGTDVVVDTTNGGVIYSLTQADGDIEFRLSNDANDYIVFSTAANIPTITTVAAGDGDLALVPGGGDLLITGDTDVSGTLTVGAFALTSITMGDDILSRAADDLLRWAPNDEEADLQLYGFDDKDARLFLSADTDDDSGDTWVIESDESGNNLIISNGTLAVYTTKFQMSTAGDITMEGDVITLGDDEFISNATDGTVLVSTNDENMIFIVKSNNAGNGTAELILAGDAIGDAGDQWKLTAGGVAEDFIISNDTTVSGTFVTKLTIADTTGNMDIAGDLDITGGDITVPVDLTITPTGADVLVMGGLTVGSGTEAGDDNLRVEGTSALVGDVTVTGDITVTGKDIQLGAATGVKISSDDDGAITFLGTSAGADEDLTINLDDVADEITVSTSTGATMFNLDGALDLKVSGLGLTLGDAGVIFTADTDGSVTVAGIGNGTDENFVLDLDNTANTIEISTTTAAATWLYTDIGITMAESTDASQPLLWMENTKDDATCPIVRLENDRVTEADGDDLGIIYFRGSDDADGASDFITILGEANEVSAGEEAGKLSVGIKVNDGSIDFLTMKGDTGGGDTGQIEFNSGTIDIDFHIDSNDQADLFLIESATNDLTLTRNLAAAATTDGPILVVSNTSATGDVGVASFLNAAGASATEATVKILSSAAGVVKSSLLVDHNGTAGATTEAAVVIDTDDVNTAGLYIMSPCTAGGTSDIFDHFVLAVVAEGVGGGANIYRNQATAVESLLKVFDDNADTTAITLEVLNDGDVTNTADIMTVVASNAAFAKTALFVDVATTTGTSLNPAVEIDSESVDTAALIIRAPIDASGTDPVFDDYVVGIGAEGVGGGLHVYRNVDDATGSLVYIEDDHVCTTNNGILLEVQTDADASASNPAVLITTTSTAHDQAALAINQVGTTALLLTDGGVTLSVEDITTSAGDPTGTGAATLTTVITAVTTDDTGANADEITLADSVKGDIKIFTLKADTETSGLKIIPATFPAGTYILLEDVGDGCILVFDGTSWVVVANNGGTIG